MEAELCFPLLLNASCRRPQQQQPRADGIVFYVLLSCVSLATVSLNLLVIISISHFRQLHTPTNLLLLSLAVSDLLVGLILMPVRLLLSGSSCWYLGSVGCGLFFFSSFVLTSASVGNMVLVSVDRYVAICDPLRYPCRVTPRRVKVCVCVCWSCCVCYNGLILQDFLQNPDRHNSCYGECVMVLTDIIRVFDMVLTFVGPIAVIVALYLRVFMAAATQARAVRSQVAAVTLQGHAPAKGSSRKAATAVSVVVGVFLICLCPFFCSTLVPVSSPAGAAFSVFGLWLLYLNSCLNPLIYALFYPWFRRSVRLIVTLQILQPGSSQTHIL